MPVDHLVVYGTLRRELQHPCHRVLEALSEFKGRVKFRGELYDLGAYPGVRIRPGASDIVCGELYRLIRPQDTLKWLDTYEGFDPRSPASSLFCREAIDVFQSEGDTVKAWVYQYNGSVTGRARIASGDYLDFRRRPSSLSAPHG